MLYLAYPITLSYGAFWDDLKDNKYYDKDDINMIKSLKDVMDDESGVATLSCLTMAPFFALMTCGLPISVILLALMMAPSLALMICGQIAIIPLFLFVACGVGCIGLSLIPLIPFFPCLIPLALLSGGGGTTIHLPPDIYM